MEDRKDISRLSEGGYLEPLCCYMGSAALKRGNVVDIRSSCAVDCDHNGKPSLTSTLVVEGHLDPDSALIST